MELTEIPRPVADFILEQTDIIPVATNNGYFYYHGDVITLMKRYAKYIEQENFIKKNLDETGYSFLPSGH